MKHLTSSLFFLLLIGLSSCQSRYPEGVMNQLMEEYPIRHVTYYSPSVLEGLANLDSSNSIAPYLDGIESAYSFSYAATSEDDSLDPAIAPDVMELVAQLEWEPLLPGGDFLPGVKAVGSGYGDKITTAVIAWSQGDEVTVYEIHGTDLRSKLTELALKAIFSGGLTNLMPLTP